MDRPLAAARNRTPGGSLAHRKPCRRPDKQSGSARANSWPLQCASCGGRRSGNRCEPPAGPGARSQEQRPNQAGLGKHGGNRGTSKKRRGPLTQEYMKTCGRQSELRGRTGPGWPRSEAATGPPPREPAPLRHSGQAGHPQPGAPIRHTPSGQCDTDESY